MRVRLENRRDSLVIVSLYCRPSEGIARHLRKLVRIARANVGKEVIIKRNFTVKPTLDGVTR